MLLEAQANPNVRSLHDTRPCIGSTTPHMGVRQNPPHPIRQKGSSLDAHPDAYPDELRLCSGHIGARPYTNELPL